MQARKCLAMVSLFIVLGSGSAYATQATPPPTTRSYGEIAKTGSEFPTLMVAGVGMLMVGGGYLALNGRKRKR